MLGKSFIVRVSTCVMMGLVCAPLGASDLNSCSQSFKELLKEDPIKAIDQHVLARLKEAPSNIKAKSKEITSKLVECFNSSKLTPRQRKAAKVNLAMNMVVPVSSIIWAHSEGVKSAQREGIKAPDFPFDLMGTVIVLYAWTSLIQCQNEVMSNEAADIGFAKQKLTAFKRYLKMDMSGTVLYMGAVTLEDHIRGRDVVSADYASDLAKEGAFSLAWDVSLASGHVLILDKVLMRYLSGGRTWLTQLINSNVFKGRWANLGGKKILYLKAEDYAAAPGLFLEFMIRQGYISARAFGFVNLRNELFGSKESVDADQESLEDLNN